MFTIDQTITGLKLREKDMFKVYFSMNNHEVATPEMMLEDARSYILFFRTGGGKASAYIGLHLLLTGRKLFYAHSSNPFPVEKMRSIEEEALTFAEELGALLDELDFSRLSDEEKHRWIDKQDIFKPEPEPEPGNVRAPSLEAARQEVPPALSPAPGADIPAAGQPQTQPEHFQPASPPVSGISPAQQVSPTPSEQAPQQPPAQPIQYTPQAPQPQQIWPDAPPAAIIPELPAVQFEETVTEKQEQYEPVVEVPEPRDQKAQPHASPREQNHRSQIQEATKQPRERRTAAAAPQENRSRSVTGNAGPKFSTALNSTKTTKEIIEQAIKAGIVKAPKQPLKKGPQPAAGLVSRDREALARLLTSF